MSKDNNNNDFEGLGKLLDHNYDNIRELDNPLPGWWLVSFWGTIVFGVIYYAYYELFGGPSLQMELKEAMSKIESQMQAQAPQTQSNLAAVLGNADAIAKGKASFSSKCIACHGPEGGGGIGPNLTDDYWLHGGAPEKIQDTITKGVLEKGMPAWGAVLPADEIGTLVAFIKSIHDTHPANAKAPQGDKEEEKEKKKIEYSQYPQST